MKKIILFSPLLFLLTACGSGVVDLYTSDADTTSGDVGPFVETSNIELSASSFYSSELGPGKDGMLITLRRGDTKKNLRVGASDRLRVILNGSSQFVEEVRNVICAGGLGPCHYAYYYRIKFTGKTDSQPLTISLERTTGINSQTTVTFPPRPTITAPLAGTVVNLSTDTLNIAWQPSNAGEEARLLVLGDCGLSTDLRFMDARSTYSFAPGTFKFSTDRAFCINATELPVRLHTIRYQDYPADPALAVGSLVQLNIEDEVSVRMRP